MARRAARRVAVTKRVQLVILPGRKRAPLAKRVKLFIHIHSRTIGVGFTLLVAVVMVLLKERRLAAVSVISVSDEAVRIFADILVDRIFPGGEFTRGE